MTQTTLKQLCSEHSGKLSDKWEIYLGEYDRIFSKYRDRSIDMLEIGIQNGGSLEVWAKYFPAARKFIGCDIDRKCGLLRYVDPRIVIVVGDANTDSVQGKILSETSALQIVIDDGSHRSGDIVKSFFRYFPALSDDGIYVAEDLHCSYWREFDGGLLDPTSSIEFFKRLVDVINYEHWDQKEPAANFLQAVSSKYNVKIDTEVLQQVHSVEFINSMCVIRKASPALNLLGERVISGSEEKVATGHSHLNGSRSARTPNRRRLLFER